MRSYCPSACKVKNLADQRTQRVAACPGPRNFSCPASPQPNDFGHSQHPKDGRGFGGTSPNRGHTAQRNEYEGL